MFDLSRETLRQYSLDMRQFIDGRESRLTNGMRIIELYNSSGLRLSLLPDRGFDIWTAEYNGLSLTWLSAGSPFPADYGSTWLRQFNGGLLTTCGLTHVGHAERDPKSNLQRGVHGHATRLQTYRLSYSGEWIGERYQFSITGELAQSHFFGEQFHLKRVYRIWLGEPSLEIEDTVTNLSDQPAPLMFLHHFNVGYPLIAEGAHLYLPAEASYSRDSTAAKGFETWPLYAAPQAAYAEQVFYHHNKQQEGWTQATLISPHLGLEIAWQAEAAPYLTQWKNTRQGIYVCGIEPGNCIPEGQNAARANGRLQWLTPGSSQTFQARLRILPNEEAQTESLNQIAALNQDGAAITGCRLNDFQTKQRAIKD